jgi:hypothetical protein
MLTSNQVARMISAEIAQYVTPGDTALEAAISTVADKIVVLTDDNGATVAAAMLENEVTSTLLDLTVATVLATLIEEEGGGRSNVSISPMSMDHMMKHYEPDVRLDGLIRHVSIKLRDDSDLKNEAAWREPSNRHGVMHQDEDTTGAKAQAEPHEYNRPVWAVNYFEGGARKLLNCHDREDAARQCRYLPADLDPRVENRHCLHPDCPSSRCNVWKDDDAAPGNGMNPDGN